MRPWAKKVRKSLKSSRTGNQDKAVIGPISTNGWLEYYSDLVTEDRSASIENENAC